MSIASKLNLLRQDIANARAKITEKGGAVTQGGGSSRLATDIDTIPTGGGAPKYGATINGIFGDVNSSGVLQPPTEATNLVFSGVKSVPAQSFRYAFYQKQNIKGVSFPDLQTVGNYDFQYAFYSSSSANGNITTLSLPSVRTVGSYGFNYAFYNQRLTGCEIEIPNMTSASTYSFSYAFYGSTGLKTFRTSSLTSITSSYAFQYAFQNCNNTNLEVTFGGLTAISGTNVFYYSFNNSRLFYHKVGHPFPDLVRINGSSVFTNAFGYSGAKRMVFDKLEYIGDQTSTTTRVFSMAFVSANMEYEVASDYDRRGVFFPSLKTIGYDGASSTRNFDTFFQNGTNHTLHFYDLTTVNNSSSTPSYGQFIQCQAKRIYMPKVTSLGSYNQYVFYNSTQTEEIHFGMENEATITAMGGYSTKFGATNATIYFDMANHITVNGINYYRSGKDCDLDDWYFAWSNPVLPTDIIYTTDFKCPAVGSTTYVREGSSYVATPYTVTAYS